MMDWTDEESQPPSPVWSWKHHVLRDHIDDATIMKSVVDGADSGDDPLKNE